MPRTKPKTKTLSLSTCSTGRRRKDTRNGIRRGPMYDTFHGLLHDPVFTWRVETNRLIAEKDAWKRVFKQNLFAKAYRYRGEPKWRMLAVIFDPTQQWDEETEESEEVHESDGDGDSSAADPILDSGVVCR
ncbi:hypothetical protein Salat_0215700 [Sesamum alatum]|uniref:Uncharacterized protein n=1 Tax=Sesamum alatum TaxID=300844 RepID=A0AAE1YZZ0_9LAMI|nr:hypothetical protein Salat_0215700 [Sesamum alatum]